MKRGDLRDKLCKLLEEAGASFGSDALAGELVDVIERGKMLRLEPDGPPLPARLVFTEAEMVVAVDAPTFYIAAVSQTAAPEVQELRRLVLPVMVAAYNERQEINEIEADVDDALSTGLAALCREEIDAEVEAGVAAERARCAAIVGDLERFWSQHSGGITESIKEARRKIESGEPAVDVSTWTGADDLPNPGPDRDFDSVISEYLEWSLRTFPASTAASVAAHLTREAGELQADPTSAEELADIVMLAFHSAARQGLDLTAVIATKLPVLKARQWNPPNAEGFQEHVKPTPDPAPDWPERLTINFDDDLAPSAGPGRALVRGLTPKERQEVIRRWEAEPELRRDCLMLQSRVDRAIKELERMAHVGPNYVAPYDNAYRILTGKEEGHG